jgi:hypothetical protein
MCNALLKFKSTRALAFSVHNPELEFGNNLNNLCGGRLKSRDLAGQIFMFSNQAMPHFSKGGIYKVFSINLTKFVSERDVDEFSNLS